MMVQVLPPGVQDHQQADRRTQTLGIGRDFAQRGRGAAHQQIIHDGGVGPGQVAERRRQCEDDMMVFDRQQVLCLLVEPTGAGQCLALGTVAVATRVVGDPLSATIEAMLDMAAQRRRAARRQVAQRFPAARPSTARHTWPGTPCHARESLPPLPPPAAHDRRW